MSPINSELLHYSGFYLGLRKL